MPGAVDDASHRFGLRRARAASLAGPLLTAAILVAFELLDRAGIRVPHLAPVCLTTVAFSAFIGGLGPGLVSAAFTMGYAAANVLGLAGQPVRFSPFDNLTRQTALLITAPLVAVMVGVLRDWHRRAVLRGIRRELLERERRIQETDAQLQLMETRAVRLRTLTRLNQMVSSSLDTDAVLADIAGAAAELMQVPFGAIWVADDEGRRLAVRASSDPALADGYPVRGVALGEGGVGWAARERQPLAVDDVTADPRFIDADWWGARGLQAAYQVPVALGDRLLGVLALHGSRPLRPTADEAELLESFVAQAALAIRNAQLYAESSAHARRLEILTELTRVIAATLEANVILKHVAASAVALFPDAGCRLWTAAADRIELRAESGIRGVGGGSTHALARGEGLVGQVWSTRQPRYIPDIGDVADLVNADWVRSQGFVSAAAVPLLVGERAIGVLVLVTRASYRWGAAEVRLLEAVAEHATVAIEKARLFRDTQDRRQLTEDLYAIKVAMERTMDLPARVRAFVQGAGAALGFDRCHVLLATEDGRALELVAGTDHREDDGPLRVPLDAGGGIAVVWQSGQSLVVGSDEHLAALPPLAPALRQVKALRARRFALVPLKFRDRPIGMVAVDQKSSRRPLTARSIAQLELYCQALAIAVANARLYAETQRREQEARVLFEATRRLAATLDLESILGIVTDSAAEALGCDGSALYRWDAGAERLSFVHGCHLDPDQLRQVRLRSGEGIGGRVHAEARAVWTNDRNADLSLQCSPAHEALFLHHQTPRAILGMPVIEAGAVYAVLYAAYREPHEWTEGEVRLGGALATQAAVAIRNARLYAEARQNLAGAALLNEAGRTLHRTLDVRRLLPDALAGLGQTFSAGATAVVLFGTRGEGPAVFRWGMVDDDGAVALASPLRRRETPILRPEAVVPGATGRAPEAPGTTSAAAFPLRGRARILGGLCLIFPEQRSLLEFEVRLLSAYADQLALALDNATLFEEAENKRTQLEQVFASTSDGFLVLDLAGRVLGLNRHAGEMFGVAPTEVIGESLARLMEATAHSVDWAGPGGRALAGVLSTPTGPGRDVEIRAATGRRTVAWQAAPTRDLLGSAVGVTVTLRDVTREREVDRMKTDFVSVVSHELRTPLTSIKGSLDLLISEPAGVDDQTRQRLITISIKNTDRLIRLINDILDISKIEAGRIQLHLDHHPVESFVAVAVDGIAALAASKQIPIERSLAPGLPPVRVDFDRMVQVLTNLLSNAIKLSPPGRPVRVSAIPIGREVEIRVTDEGRGIAQEDVKKLFTRFQQLDSGPAREGGGSGLGLAICRGIVEEHGGKISVESRLGAGATFVVRLPAVAADAVLPEPADPAPVEAPLVLVVDDERDLRELLRDMLLDAGFRVIEAGRALDAVEMARTCRPDLVTMDVMMPDLDGFEAVRLLRQTAETRDTPVIMISGVEFDPDSLRALGSTALLNKPFSEVALFDAVRAQLGERGSVRR
ncbi:MAG TPA: GAF domain-containing protein [Candidatus Binatia bacterium]|nr:GAF domain-containing protein [Candidatus Binatia bacterium]